MSKVGKKLILIPEGVHVETKADVILVKGPRGEIERKFPVRLLSITVQDGMASVKPISKSEKALVVWGTTRSHLANMVVGVTDGWKKSLELVGVGYRAEVSGKDLTLTVGFSHPVKISCPEGISFKVEKSIVSVEGIDKEIVGQVADKIRSVRPPEPYKGKGIKYVDEIVRRKAGKAAKTQGA